MVERNKKCLVVKFERRGQSVSYDKLFRSTAFWTNDWQITEILREGASATLNTAHHKTHNDCLLAEAGFPRWEICDCHLAHHKA